MPSKDFIGLYMTVETGTILLGLIMVLKSIGKRPDREIMSDMSVTSNSLSQDI